MVCQVFNLSDKKIFNDFSIIYKIYREIFDSGLFGIEIRDLHFSTAEEIYKLILEENEICYKNSSEGHSSDILIPGSVNQLKRFSRKVISSGHEEIGYRLLNSISNYEDYNKISYNIGGKEFIFNKTYIMGILNITPDSFSDGGLFYDRNKAVEHAVEMVDAGADLVDVGGESTRPGSEPVSTSEEINRVIPVIENILKIKPDTLISVDTTKSHVAARALDTGAVLVNDISGLTYDQDMARVVSDYKAGIVVMHILGKPKTMQKNPEYNNVVKDVFDFLMKQTETALKEGIKNIIIDPGIGFGKTVEHNFELLKMMDSFKCLGYPILAGVSRKSFIGKTLEIDINNRDEATAITETTAVLKGARIIRTHNVRYCKYVSILTEKLL
jgi:dihydropteroate synthase